jgi:hypothetical protein
LVTLIIMLDLWLFIIDSQLIKWVRNLATKRNKLTSESSMWSCTSNPKTSPSLTYSSWRWLQFCSWQVTWSRVQWQFPTQSNCWNSKYKNQDGTCNSWKKIVRQCWRIASRVWQNWKSAMSQMRSSRRLTQVLIW